MKSWLNNRHKLIIADEKVDMIKNYIKENSYIENLNELSKVKDMAPITIIVINMYMEKIPSNSLYGYLPHIKTIFNLQKPQFIRFDIKNNTMTDSINFLFDGINFYHVKDFYRHNIDTICRSKYYMALTTLSVDDPLYYELSNGANDLYYLINNSKCKDIIKYLYNINDSAFMSNNENGHIHDKICRCMMTGPTKFDHGTDICEESYFIYPKNEECYIRPKNLEFRNYKSVVITDFVNCTQYVDYNYQKLVELVGEDQIYMGIVDMFTNRSTLRKCRLEFDCVKNMIKIVMEDIN